MISINTMLAGSDQTTGAILVNATADAWTAPLPVPCGEDFSIEALAASDGTVEVDVIMELGNELPTNYNAADDNFVQHEGYSSPTIALADEVKHIAPISPVVSKYIRFKLDGKGSNHASTTVTIKLLKIHY